MSVQINEQPRILKQSSQLHFFMVELFFWLLKYKNCIFTSIFWSICAQNNHLDKFCNATIVSISMNPLSEKSFFLTLKFVETEIDFKGESNNVEWSSVDSNNVD